MKNITIAFFLVLIIILSGCNNKEITKEKAKEIVIEQHSSNIGQIDITLVITESEKYIIKWENDPLEEGLDSINKKTGDLQEIESSHGTCEWK